MNINHLELHNYLTSYNKTQNSNYILGILLPILLISVLLTIKSFKDRKNITNLTTTFLCLLSTFSTGIMSGMLADESMIENLLINPLLAFVIILILFVVQIFNFYRK